MANVTVAIMNENDRLIDKEIKTAIPALQIQVHRDFTPIWRIDADLVAVPSGSPAGAWRLVVFDDSDQPGPLGCHDTTNDRLPSGKIFAGTDPQLGLSWTVTASHELLEILSDPEIDLTVLVQPSARSGILYPYEDGDACEDDPFSHKVGGLSFTDFVQPAWLDRSRKPGGTQFDHGSRLKAPVLSLLQGGYSDTIDVTTDTGWHQITADDIHSRAANRARVGSRREYRRIPRDQWRRSKPDFR